MKGPTPAGPVAAAARPADGAAGLRQTLVALVPAALAIAVYGTIFGAMARPLLGPVLTVVASAVIFSGTVQFAVTGLLLGGATPGALLLTAAAVNLRNPFLAAVLRPHLRAGALGRALLGWFVIDETLGFTLAARDRAEATLLASGALCYAAWVGGTALGAAGASLLGLQGIAGAVFPVLFVGLAALSASRRHLVVRALVAAALTAGIAALWPAARGVAPVLAALLVALPGGEDG